MSKRVFVVVRDELLFDGSHNTTVEGVFGNDLFGPDGYTKALRFVDAVGVYPNVEFFIEEMPVQ